VVHRAPAAIVIATVEGVLSERLAFCGADSAPPWVIDVDESRENPFALLRRRPLVLVAEHPVVRVARARAVTDPIAAASYLARGVFLAYRMLDVQRSENLVRATLDRIGIA